MDLDSARRTEVARYRAAYKRPCYRIGAQRRAHVQHHLERIPKGSLLDVSTGRGEVLNMARALGHTPVQGTEVVDYLCNGDNIVHAYAHALPFADKSFDTVTMFDVMEHLLPEDTAAVCRELKRVARHRVLLTVCNKPSFFGGDGRDLHINRRASYTVWHAELTAHFDAAVCHYGNEGSISEMFEVEL